LSRTDVSRPATFREIFSVREFRALYLATTLSWVGDYAAKAAVTVLVYRQTNSAVITAATFAISYLPWALGGPLLTALAERRPHRTTMVFCDAFRAVLIALVALPREPVPVMLALLFLTAMFTPPFEGSRSATMPAILPGEKYVLATSVMNSSSQGSQILGYLLGSAVAVSTPRGALLADAVSFAVSGALILFGTRWRPAVVDPRRRGHLVREAGAGIALVFRGRVLRAIAVLILTSVPFAMPPEGLAAVWAASLEHDPARRGVAQAIIMIGSPLGLLIAGLLLTRLVSPYTRTRLVRPLAVLGPLCMVPALFNPSAPVVALLACCAGICYAGLLPTANGLFVQALPVGYRARAFGVMQTGLQLLKGASVLFTGWLASYFPLPGVVGIWSAFGVLLILGVVSLWPAPSVFAETFAQTRAANDATLAALAGEAASAGEAARPTNGVPVDGVPRNGVPVDGALLDESTATTAPVQRSSEDPSDGRIRTVESM
jgi:MFS family permease